MANEGGGLMFKRAELSTFEGCGVKFSSQAHLFATGCCCASLVVDRLRFRSLDFGCASGFSKAAAGIICDSWGLNRELEAVEAAVEVKNEGDEAAVEAVDMA